MNIEEKLSKMLIEQDENLEKLVSKYIEKHQPCKVEVNPLKSVADDKYTWLGYSRHITIINTLFESLRDSGKLLFYPYRSFSPVDFFEVGKYIFMVSPSSEYLWVREMGKNEVYPCLYNKTYVSVFNPEGLEVLNTCIQGQLDELLAKIHKRKCKGYTIMVKGKYYPIDKNGYIDGVSLFEAEAKFLKEIIGF